MHLLYPISVTLSSNIHWITVTPNDALFKMPTFAPIKRVGLNGRLGWVVWYNTDQMSPDDVE